MDETKPTIQKPEQEAPRRGGGKEMSPKPKPINPDEVETLVFYNVAPKQPLRGGVIGPEMKIQENLESQGSENPVVSILKKYRRHALIVFGILVLGVGVYFAITKIFSRPLKDDFTINPEALKNSEQSESQQSTTTPGTGILTAEWLLKYYGTKACESLDECGEEADSDSDGLKNKDEFRLNTDPNNKDSDNDGLADGDEINVFMSKPMDAHSTGEETYSDADFIRGGYDFSNSNAKYNEEQLLLISGRMKQYGLHQPTVSTVGVEILQTLYKFTYTEPENTKSEQELEVEEQESAEKTNLDQSPEAKQDRDGQRSGTMKNISIALIKFYDDREKYPAAGNFQDMVSQIKPYTRVAINPVDPINQGNFVYAYSVSEDKNDFILTFYSETQSQTIKIKSADGRKYLESETAAQFDDQRKTDMEMIRTSLLLYSNKNIAGNQDYVFPLKNDFKTALVPDYMTSLPKDPVTKNDYEYSVSENFDTFTLKSLLDAPPSGNTGFLCNQEECRYY